MKQGILQSPPKSNYQPPGGGANTSGNDSSTTDLIIPEEVVIHVFKSNQREKYSSRNGRHRARHKH